MVRSFGSLACNCCSCTDCCNGSAPDEFDVDITLTDAGDCPACATFLSGTYTVARINDGYGNGPCIWQYVEGMPSGESNYPYPVDDIAFCDEGCVDTGACWYISYRFVGVYIHCISDTHYRVDVTVAVEGVYYPPETPPYTICPEIATSRRFGNTWRWTKDVARADFDCTTVVSEAIPYVSRLSYCIADIYVAGAGFQPPNRWFCEDNPADAVLSAVVPP